MSAVSTYGLSSYGRSCVGQRVVMRPHGRRRLGSPCVARRFLVLCVHADSRIAMARLASQASALWAAGFRPTHPPGSTPLRRWVSSTGSPLSGRALRGVWWFTPTRVHTPSLRTPECRHATPLACALRNAAGALHWWHTACPVLALPAVLRFGVVRACVRGASAAALALGCASPGVR